MEKENALDWANVNQVVRNLKEIGSFIQFDRDDTHYLLTEYFVMRLRWRDAFRIQCKTETERRGIWYQTEKGRGFVESPQRANIDAYLESYYTVISAGEGEKNAIAPTGLAVTRYHDAPMSAELFAGKTGGYVAVRQEYLGMAASPAKTIACVGNSIVVNGQFMLGILQDDVWQENQYIRDREAKA